MTAERGRGRIGGGGACGPEGGAEAKEAGMEEVEAVQVADLPEFDDDGEGAVFSGALSQCHARIARVLGISKRQLSRAGDSKSYRAALKVAKMESELCSKLGDELWGVGCPLATEDCRRLSDLEARARLAWEDIEFAVGQGTEDADAFAWRAAMRFIENLEERVRLERSVLDRWTASRSVGGDLARG